VAKKEKTESSVPRPDQTRWAGDEERQLLGVMREAESAYEDALLRLSRQYSKGNRPQDAIPLMERLALITQDPEKKAFCHLSVGQLYEQVREYATALDHYGRALLLEPTNSCSWYFIHNNIGCCLNHAERFEEAEQYCRDAIRIDAARYNAHINLGVSLEAQERYVDAAKSFLDAMMTNAVDVELLEHLEGLVNEHMEIEADMANIRSVLEEFRLDHGF
jgi:tetratricopeptide (TPR) repeat protein